MFARIHAMRKLGVDSCRLQALSLPEIERRVRDLVHRFARDSEGFKVAGRRPRESHVINVVLLHFLSLDQGEQARAYIEAKEKLERLMDLDAAATDEAIDAILSPELPGKGGPSRHELPPEGITVKDPKPSRTRKRNNHG